MQCHSANYNSKQVEDIQLAETIYYNFLLRIIEYIETVFFILRKKNKQASTLHIYHHITTVFLVYLEAKFIGGGSFFFPLVLNTFVHVIMYTYYFLAALGPRGPQRAVRFIKKYITQIQLVSLY